jgi:hypothetical protein
VTAWTATQEDSPGSPPFDALVRFEADVVAPAVPRLQELERQGRQVGRARLAKIVAGACEQERSRLLVVVGSGSNEHFGQRRTRRTDVLPADPLHVAETEPPSPTGQVDECDLRADLAREPNRVDAGTGAARHVLHQALVGDQLAQRAVVALEVRVQPRQHLKG